VLHPTSPNPSLLRRGIVLPLYSKGESEGVAHAIAKFQISVDRISVIGGMLKVHSILLLNKKSTGESINAVAAK
jgi:hypothetical protein